jgi:hypothetical protein
MEQLGSPWKDFHEIWYLVIFRKPVEKIQDILKSDINNGYCTWRQIYIFDGISLNYSLNDKYFVQNLYRKSKYTVYAKYLFTINSALYEIMWKTFVKSNRPQNDNTVHAHCMLDTQCCKHTLRMYNICYFSTMTIVARTCLIVVLYLHYPSCSCYLYLSLQWNFYFVFAASNRMEGRKLMQRNIMCKITLYYGQWPAYNVGHYSYEEAARVKVHTLILPPGRQFDQKLVSENLPFNAAWTY